MKEDTDYLNAVLKEFIGDHYMTILLVFIMGFPIVLIKQAINNVRLRRYRK